MPYIAPVAESPMETEAILHQKHQDGYTARMPAVFHVLMQQLAEKSRLRGWTCGDRGRRNRWPRWRAPDAGTRSHQRSTGGPIGRPCCDSQQSAGYVRIPVLEDACRVVHEDPGVQDVYAQPLVEVQVLAEHLRELCMLGVPGLGRHDVLDGRQL